MGDGKKINDCFVRTPFPAALQIANKIHSVVNYDLAQGVPPVQLESRGSSGKRLRVYRALLGLR